jgi:hypothetical protein
VSADGRDADHAGVRGEDGRDVMASTTLHPQLRRIVPTLSKR